MRITYQGIKHIHNLIARNTPMRNEEGNFIVFSITNMKRAICNIHNKTTLTQKKLDKEASFNDFLT